MRKEKCKIEKLDHQGRGISHFHDKIIFIENALPKEEVEVNITKSTKKYFEGITTHILKSSKTRIEPACPYYFSCGGCQLLHMNKERQDQFKENKVKEIFSKYMDEQIKINPLIKSSFPYRNKATFQVKEKIGYYKRKSYDIIAIDHCLLLHPKMNEILQFMKNNIPLTGIRQVVIRYGYFTDELMVVLIGDKMAKEKIISLLKEKVTVLSFYQNKKYEYITEKKQIREKIGNMTYSISPSSFFQVNTYQAKNLYDIVKSYVDKNDNVLDLYCGIGSIGIYISDIVKSVVGIEINPIAIENANENKKNNCINNIQFLCSDVSLVKEKYKNINTIIVDPPRAGLDKGSINYIFNYQAKKIIYVSCDIMTLVRDLNLLKEKYEIVKINPVDMFPGTYHVECVCLLKLK